VANGSYWDAAIAAMTGIALAFSILIQKPIGYDAGTTLAVLSFAGLMSTLIGLSKVTDQTDLSNAFMQLRGQCPNGHMSEVDKLSIEGAFACKLQSYTDLSSGAVEALKGIYLPPAVGFADNLSTAIQEKPKNPCEAAVQKASKLCPAALSTILSIKSEQLRKVPNSPNS
jgi:hypothetical protein